MIRPYRRLPTRHGNLRRKGDQLERSCFTSERNANNPIVVRMAVEGVVTLPAGSQDDVDVGSRATAFSPRIDMRGIGRSSEALFPSTTRLNPSLEAAKVAVATDRLAALTIVLSARILAAKQRA